MKRLYIFLFTAVLIPQIIFAQSWVQQNSGTTQILESVFMLNESEGWVCGDAGTFLHTTNGGTIWFQVSITGQNLSDVAFRNSQNGILVGDDGLIMRTTNGGLNWSLVSSGTTANLAAVSWASDNIVFISGRDGAALLSNNAGASFIQLNTGSATRYRGANAFNNKLWAVGEGGIIRHSANTGTSWQGQPNPATNDLHDIQFLTENTGFAGGSNSMIIYTTDGGTNWQSRSAGINFGINGIYFINENSGWAVSDGGIIYFTSNAGLNWAAQNTGLAVQINEIHFPSASKGWAVGDNGTIFFLDNGVPVELTNFTGTVNGSNIILNWSTATETNNSGFEIQRKISGAAGWTSVGFVKGEGSTTAIHNYSFSDNSLDAGTYSYRLKQVDYDGRYEYHNLKNEITISQVKDYSLKQNYPNPFNPVTNIHFSIPENGNVKLKVYNLLGTEVATLVNGYKNQGEHSINFNAADLPSGIYLYKLETGSFTQVRKMTLLK